MSSHGCELSPSAAAFSSMLGAFISSILNGLFSGFWIAFFTGWISWLSVIRILVAGVYEFYLSIKAGTDYHAVGSGDTQYQSIGLNMYRGAAPAPVSNDVPPPYDEEARLTQETNAAQHHFEANHRPDIAAHIRRGRAMGGKPPIRTVTVFGWLGWIWSAVYTPISQSIFLAVQITSDNGVLLFVRALAIGVSALGLTFDYKQRYGAALAKRWGSWAFVVFNVWNSTACLLLGCETLALLIRGATNISNLPIPLLVMYPIFSCVWALGSWSFLRPIDGARPGINVVADVFMGAFAGIFVAAPAFALWQNNKFKAETNFGGYSESGMGLGDYLNCESASVLSKFSAVMP